ncbi:protein O-glucosyltransferase 2-like [Chironomus tepperi]|uniref:protein O-glucosyltransferase 2-like n=1 Tax=Chironomus tepperi TaxID=113505 RepID=UPI00391F91AB
MWKLILINILRISLTHSWIHDGKIIGTEIIRNGINLPVSYFFVQFQNIYGQNITFLSERDQNLFNFSLQSNCRRLSFDKIYAGDGLFILRIRTYQECHYAELELKFRNKHLKDSPICLKSIYPDNCKCPKDLKTFKNLMNCGDKVDDQIENDLSNFKEVNFTEMRNFVKSNFENSRSSSVCNYVIKNNEIYRKCYGQYVGFKMFVDAVLISLKNKVNLPDLEFFFNLGDWPLIKITSNEKFPLFSWCGSKTTLDIVVPTYELTESTINMMFRTSIDIFSVQKEKYKWNEKISKAFFKGRDSRRERLELVSLARKYPNLLNCTITNFFFFKDEISIYGPKSDHIAFTDFFEYKYQINVDGTVAAYRFPYLLASNSVVLKQDSNYYEHFYNKLEPYKHFIPFNHDPKLNLIEKILSFIQNDNEARKISKTARKFVLDNLLPKNIYCYFVTLFEKFSEKIVSPISILNDMEKLEDNSIECSCKKK